MGERGQNRRVMDGMGWDGMEMAVWQCAIASGQCPRVDTEYPLAWHKGGNGSYWE